MISRIGIATILCAVLLVCNICDGAEPEWLGSKEGITDKVLAPWTPIRIAKGKDKLDIGVWGRSYGLGRSIFPSTMKTQGKAILDKPISIDAQANGTPIAWNMGKLQLQESTSARVSFCQEAVAKDKSIVLSARTIVDYDGMIRVDWELLPQTSLRLDSLTVEISMPAKYVNQLYTNTGRHFYPKDSAYVHVNANDPARTYRIGAIPANGVLRGFAPVVWLGNEDIGLEWFCESNKNWFNKDTESAIEVIKDRGSVILRLRLVETPLELSPDDAKTRLAYTFGFEATPVKPMEKDGWDYRTISSPIYGRDYAVLTEKIEDKIQIDYLKERGVRTVVIMNWTPILCYNKPLSREQDLRDLVKACHDRDMQLLVYLGNQISEESPEAKDFQEQIAWRPGYRQQDRYPNEPYQWVEYVCNQSVWRDFIVDGVAKLIDNYDIDGVYLDGTASPMPCENEKHGCGYRDSNAELHKTYPIFGTRDMIRRIYTAVRSRKPDGQVTMHLAGGMIVMPAAGWGTCYWAGETLDKEVFPLNDEPLDLFRTELMGHQLGVPADFLHYSAFSNTAEGFNNALAYSLLHDVLARPHGSAYMQYKDIDIASKLWAVSDKFGRNDAKWLPYWRNSRYVTSSKGTYASLYKHPKNGILAIVSNISGRETVVEADFNLAELGLGSIVTATDALEDSRIEIMGGKVKLQMPSPGWKVIWLK